MKMILGLLTIIVGIILGIYLGIFVMFIGGITQFVEGLKSTPIDSLKVALGIAKFIFSGVVGWLSFGIFCGIGCALMEGN